MTTPDEIIAASERATAGPWQVKNDVIDWDVIVGNVDGEYVNGSLVHTYETVCTVGDNALANAAFILLACNNAKRLALVAKAAQGLVAISQRDGDQIPGDIAVGLAALEAALAELGGGG